MYVRHKEVRQPTCSYIVSRQRQVLVQRRGQPTYTLAAPVLQMTQICHTVRTQNQRGEAIARPNIRSDTQI